MPRRQLPRRKLTKDTNNASSQNVDEHLKHPSKSGSEDESYSSGAEEEEGLDESEDERDADAPRIVQWEDEPEYLDDHSLQDEVEDEEEVGAESSKSQVTVLQDNLSSIPLGALLKARRALEQTIVDSDDSASDSTSSHGDPELEESNGLEEKKGKQEWSLKPRNDIAKRPHKHAPVEISSKRPVTRRMNVVETQKVRSRDPRFLPLAGELSTQSFQTDYSFLSELHKNELSTLRENLKRARKYLISSPRDARAEREAEVNRLELAVKRAESMVNQDRREAVERQALQNAKKEEKEQRKQGKSEFYMKDSVKKDIMLRARYDALATSGGKGAVKKAIEKRQKKISQKEKKSRPFAAAGGGDREKTFGERNGASSSSKRPWRPFDGDSRAKKRQKAG